MDAADVLQYSDHFSPNFLETLMCEFCPDDESDIQTHRERIEAAENNLEYARRQVPRMERDLEYVRKEFRRRLRKGHIRNA